MNITPKIYSHSQLRRICNQTTAKTRNRSPHSKMKHIHPLGTVSPVYLLVHSFFFKSADHQPNNITLVLYMTSFYFCFIGRLLSYADKYPNVNMLLQHAREMCVKGSHLLPSFSCLEVGGPEISRKNFKSRIYSLAMSNTSSGTIVICGLGNGSVTIHELETGM